MTCHNITTNLHTYREIYSNLVERFDRVKSTSKSKKRLFKVECSNHIETLAHCTIIANMTVVVGYTEEGVIYEMNIHYKMYMSA